MADFDAYEGPDLAEETGTVVGSANPGVNSPDAELDLVVSFEGVPGAFVSADTALTGTYATIDATPDPLTLIRFQRVNHRQEAESRIPEQLRRGNNPSEVEFVTEGWMGDDSTMAGGFS